MEQEMSRNKNTNKNTNKNINKNMEMGAETEFLTPTHRYDDIINLPHPISRIHQPMPIEARAAQFMPFAALTGHAEAIRETAKRHVEKWEE